MSFTRQFLCCSIERFRNTMEDVWTKVTPSHLLEVLSSCALLPFAQSFVENFAAKLAAMADARLAKEVAESPKLCQICQRSSLWCFFRSALVSRTVGLTSLSFIVQLLTCFPAPVATTVTRDSRTACRRWKAVGGGCACDRAFALSDVSAPHWEQDQCFSQRGVVDGWGILGRAKLGRAHVKARDVARSCVVFWPCAAPKYGE